MALFNMNFSGFKERELLLVLFPRMEHKLQSIPPFICLLP